jgi:type I restriction enzyme S subunit
VTTIAKLPDGWRLAQLDEVCTPVRGVTFASGEAQGLPFSDSIACLTTSGVQTEVDWESRRFIPRVRLGTEAQVLRQNDLLVSTANSKALVGKSCLVRDVPFECTFGAFVTVLRPNKHVDPYFLAMLVNSPDAKSRWYAASSNTTNISNLRVSDMLAYKFALPPLAEQQRIAAAIEARLSEVERARAAVQAQRDAADALMAAHLRAVFEGDEAQGWERRRFGELVENFDGKRVPLRHTDRNSIQGIYPYYGASGVIDYINDYIFDGHYLLISEDGANLLARTYPIAFEAKGKFWVNNHAHIVRPKPNVDMQFLLNAMLATNLEPYVTGTAQPKLTQDKMNQIMIAIPSVERQKEISHQLTNTREAVHNVSQLLVQELDLIDRLPAAILRQAFAGEL